MVVVVVRTTEGECIPWELQLEVVGMLASQPGVLNHPIHGFNMGVLWLDILHTRVKMSNLET